MVLSAAIVMKAENGSSTGRGGPPLAARSKSSNATRIAGSMPRMRNRIAAVFFAARRTQSGGGRFRACLSLPCNCISAALSLGSLSPLPPSDRVLISGTARRMGVAGRTARTGAVTHATGAKHLAGKSPGEKLRK